MSHSVNFDTNISSEYSAFRAIQVQIWLCSMLTFASPVVHSDQIKLELIPAWDGHFQPGKTTEIAIRLVSTYGRKITIEWSNRRQTVQLESGTPFSTNLLYRPSESSLVDIKVTNLPDNNVLVERTVNLKLLEDQNVAFVEPELSELLFKQRSKNNDFIESVKSIQVPSNSLPTHAAAYQSISILILAYQALQSMSESQIDALSGFIMRCGKLITVRFPSAVFDKLKNIAGCQKNFIVNLEEADNLSVQIKRMMKRRPSGLLTARKLLDTIPNQSLINLSRPLILFCFGYLIALFCFAVFGRRKMSLIALPVAASIIALIVWQNSKPVKFLVSWAEMDNNANSIRYTASLYLRGTGRTQSTLRLPQHAMPTTTTSNNLLQNKFDVDDAGIMTSVIPVTLLSTFQWIWESGLQQEAPLSIEQFSQHHVTVSNTGASATKAGFVKLKNTLLKLPPLQNGQKWSPQENAQEVDNVALKALIFSQSHESPVSVVIPFTPKHLSGTEQQIGWLLIKMAKEL